MPSLLKRMDLLNLTPEYLSKVLELVKRREALEVELAEVHRQLLRLQSGSVIRGQHGEGVQLTSFAGGTIGPKSKRYLRERIVALLKAAGEEGVAVLDLASALGMPSKNLHVWFVTTGKKEPKIKRIARGRYAWLEGSTEPAESASNEQSDAGAVEATSAGEGEPPVPPAY